MLSSELLPIEYQTFQVEQQQGDKDALLMIMSNTLNKGTRLEVFQTDSFQETLQVDHSNLASMVSM